VNWKLDTLTQNVAEKYCPIGKSTLPAAQFPGYNFNPNSDIWRRRIRANDVYCITTGKSSPEEIINAFKNEQYLQGLALTVSWGGMARARPYNRYCLTTIDNALRRCATDIHETNSMVNSWQILTNQPLQWSAIMASKTLHFLCRALGVEDHPPVVIDRVMRGQQVWGRFQGHFEKNCLPCERPHNWEGNAFEAYSRYMTAILVWAKKLNWSTTQVEVTLYNH
jgi:hypothetical protein